MPQNKSFQYEKVQCGQVTLICPVLTLPHLAEDKQDQEPWQKAFSKIKDFMHLYPAQDI